MAEKITEAPPLSGGGRQSGQATSRIDAGRGTIAPGGFVFGHPKGLFLIAGVEFWERFSYYGMTGLLVLYLTSASQAGGLNWDPASAIQFYGFYAGCAFAAPTIGGWISSRYVGERACILWGGILVACGHILLGGPVMFPAFLEWITGIEVYEILHSSGAVLGNIILQDVDVTLLRQMFLDTSGDASPGNFSVVILGYYFASWSFYLGLLFILVGTGLIKPAVSSIVSCFYPYNPLMREAGFAIFMAAIYLGAVAANFSAGTLGEKVGWHYGFTVTAVGMIAGVVVYLLKQQALLGDLGRGDNRLYDTAVPKEPLSPAEKKRIYALLIMGIGTVVYAAAFYQKGGLLNLVTKQHIDRVVYGFEVPATWFLSISTIGFVILAPLSVKLWRYLAKCGWQVSADRKLACGLASIAIGYIIISLGMSSTGEGQTEKISMLWMMATYACFAIGDVLIWPPQIATVATLAPDRWRSFAVGTWYLTIGFGTWLTGLLGSVAYIFDVVSALLLLCLLCFAAAILIWILHESINRLANVE